MMELRTKNTVLIVSCVGSQKSLTGFESFQHDFPRL
jgi:hypothetical protein